MNPLSVVVVCITVYSLTPITGAFYEVACITGDAQLSQVLSIYSTQVRMKDFRVHRAVDSCNDVRKF